MGQKPKTPTEAALASMKREAKIRRMEEKLAKGWTPPSEARPTTTKPRPPDQLEEVTPNGIQLTIFAAIAAADGTTRAKELLSINAGDAHKPRSRPRSANKTRPKDSPVESRRGDSEEEAANKAWLTATLG